MKKLLFLICLLPSLMLAATGDLTVKIRPDGWTAEVTSEGFTTGATYTFGYGTGNVPSAATPYFTVVSEGYDATGTLSTITRTVYMTSTVRMPYASKSQPGGTWSGTFVDGETMTCSTSGATAVKVGDQAAGASILFKSLTGTPLTTQTWTGGTSGATFVNTSSTITTYTVPTADERASGTALTTLVALSEYIYSDDNTGAGKSGTAPTVTIPAGFITNTGGAAQTSNALTAAAITQSSTATYSSASVIGHWSYPFGATLLDATTRLRAVAFERSGQSGKPVRCVKFSVSDGINPANTEIVTPTTWTTSLGDQEPVIEYVTTTDLTAGLTQGALCTINFIAYPWVGDASNILDTSSGTAYPTPLNGPLTAICDRTGAYGKSFAVVDAATGADPAVGSDSGKWVGDGTAHGTGAGLTPYLTIARAARAVRDRNNATSGRDDVSGSVIYVKAGSYNWLGASITGTYGATPNAAITIKPYTGVARSAVSLTGRSGDFDISDRVKLENITISSATSGTFSGCLAMWLDGCDVNSSSTSLWNTAGQRVWLTNCKITQLGQGFALFGTTDMTFPLVRGCDMDGFTQSVIPYCFIGNRKDGNTTATGTLLSGGTSGQTAPTPSSQIVAYNRLYGYSAASATLGKFADTNILPTRGLAIVQNVIEGTGTTVGSMCDIGASDGITTNTPFNNVLMWHNTFIGARQNCAYNSSGSTVKSRAFWSVKNNIFYNWNTKHDDFATENGLRIGAWPVLYGVGFSGNLIAETGLGFSHRFYGLNSTRIANWTGTGSSYFGYVDYKASVETVAGAGDGDYRLKTSAPGYRRQSDWLLPYGMGGKPRSANNDSAGAFSEGGVRPASMMFAN